MRPPRRDPDLPKAHQTEAMNDRDVSGAVLDVAGLRGIRGEVARVVEQRVVGLGRLHEPDDLRHDESDDVGMGWRTDLLDRDFLEATDGLPTVSCVGLGAAPGRPVFFAMTSRITATISSKERPRSFCQARKACMSARRPIWRPVGPVRPLIGSAPMVSSRFSRSVLSGGCSGSRARASPPPPICWLLGCWVGWSVGISVVLSTVSVGLLFFSTLSEFSDRLRVDCVVQRKPLLLVTASG